MIRSDVSRRIYQTKVCQLELIPDQRSEVMFDVIIRGPRIKSIIFVRFDDGGVVKVVTNILSSIVINPVAKFSAATILHKLLFNFITSSSQPFHGC